MRLRLRRGVHILGSSVCGIAGMYSRDGSPPTRLLLEMAGELSHRGPDGTGLYLDGSFGMVNTRLAIIDLAGGDQPLADESGRYWVMQNGEIYNYVELRAELEGLGRRFATRRTRRCSPSRTRSGAPPASTASTATSRSRSGTGVARELFLARDRFGARPLYLAELGGDLCFASECKALLRHPAARRELDPAALVESFTTWAILPDRSSFKGIRELAPAHYLIAGSGGIRAERRWWDIDFSPDTARAAESEDELVDELREVLEDATRIRLRADVPVAAYVSGGLDSSAIAAFTRRLNREELFSFGLTFRDERFDEREHQAQIAAALGTTLTQVEVDAPDIAELLPRAIELWEKPTLRTAPAPLLALSGAVRQAGLKVVLTGEAADELFAGYDIFREDKVRRFWARDPESELRPRLLARLNAFLDGTSAARAPSSPASTPAGSPTRTIRSTATGSASPTRRASRASSRRTSSPLRSRPATRSRA